MSKYILHTIVFLFFTAPLFAEQAQRVRFEIVDAKTEEPVEGATILFGNQGLVSGKGGIFELALQTGDSLKLSATGYEKFTYHFRQAQNFVVISLQPSENQLGPVVVSGTLKQVQKSESPIPVESYSAKFFKKNPTPGIFEAISILNGVQPQLNCNVCNTGDIHINGMEGPYTMILIDGMPIVSSLSTVYGLSGIPNSMVKRIEVVKGPASTLYGSEAVGGLINIITRDAHTAPKLSVELSGTTLGEINTDFSGTIHTKKATALLGANIFNFWTKQDINQDNFTDVTLQRRISLFNKWDFDRKNNLPATLAGRFFTETRWGGELNWTKAFAGSDSIYGESIDTRRWELIGNLGLRKNLMMDYSYNYHQQNSFYGTTAYNAKQHTAFGQLRYDKILGKHNLMAGVPIKYIWYDDNTVATEKNNINAPSVQTTAALFVQDEIKITGRFTSLLGLRYEYNNVQGGVLAPRIALKWQPSSQQALRLSTGNGFRMVNIFTEDHAALTGSRQVVIKNDLRPEQSWNANLNYTGQINKPWGFLAIDASAFYTYFFNKILPDYQSDPNIIYYDNLDGYAVSRGLTMNVDFGTRKGLKGLLGVTLMDVFSMQKNKREQQYNAPVFSMTYSLSYTIRRWNTSFDLTGKLFGPQRLPVLPNDFRPEYAPWFTLMNLQVTKKINTAFECFLSIKNLLNFVPKNPILHPDDPFDKPGGKYFLADGSPNPQTNPNGLQFDPNSNYGPIQGIKGMLGFRWTLQ